MRESFHAKQIFTRKLGDHKVDAAFSIQIKLKQGKTDWELSNYRKNWQGTQMDEHRYGNSEFPGSFLGLVKFSLPIFN